jgi:hypothetical protein
MDHLDHGGKLVVNWPNASAGLGREEEQSWSEAFALKPGGVVYELLDEWNSAFKLFTVDNFRGFQILSNRKIQRSEATSGLIHTAQVVCC